MQLHDVSGQLDVAKLSVFFYKRRLLMASIKRCREKMAILLPTQKPADFV